MLGFVDRQEAAKPGPAGAHGYCMSGPNALAAAARYPERIAAAASFYGTWLVNDAEESPHLSLGKNAPEVRRPQKIAPSQASQFWAGCIINTSGFRF